MIVVPVLFAISPDKLPRVPAYLAGANVQGSRSYRGAMGIEREVGLRNYYLSGFLSEAGLTTFSVILGIIVIAGMFATMFIKGV